MKYKRVTMTFNEKHMMMLEKLSEAMNKRPGEVVKDIAIEVLDGMEYMFEVEAGSEGVTSDIVLKRMFKLALTKMIDAIDDLDNPYVK